MDSEHITSNLPQTRRSMQAFLLLITLPLLARSWDGCVEDDHVRCGDKCGKFCLCGNTTGFNSEKSIGTGGYGGMEMCRAGF